MGNDKGDTVVTKNGDIITPQLMKELLIMKACTLLSFVGHCKSEEQANERMSIVFPYLFANACGYMSIKKAQEIILHTQDQRYDDCSNGE